MDYPVKACYFSGGHAGLFYMMKKVSRSQFIKRAMFACCGNA